MCKPKVLRVFGGHVVCRVMHELQDMGYDIYSLKQTQDIWEKVSELRGSAWLGIDKLTTSDIEDMMEQVVEVKYDVS